MNISRPCISLPYDSVLCCHQKTIENKIDVLTSDDASRVDKVYSEITNSRLEGDIISVDSSEYRNTIVGFNCSDIGAKVIIINDYSPKECLGKGAFGEVYSSCLVGRDSSGHWCIIHDDEYNRVMKIQEEDQHGLAKSEYDLHLSQKSTLGSGIKDEYDQKADRTKTIRYLDLLKAPGISARDYLSAKLTILDKFDFVIALLEEIKNIDAMGFAHPDPNLGNIFIDPATKKIQFIDMAGVVQKDRPRPELGGIFFEAYAAPEQTKGKLATLETMLFSAGVLGANVFSKNPAGFEVCYGNYQTGDSLVTNYENFDGVELFPDKEIRNKTLDVFIELSAENACNRLSIDDSISSLSAYRSATAHVEKMKVENKKNQEEFVCLTSRYEKCKDELDMKGREITGLKAELQVIQKECQCSKDNERHSLEGLHKRKQSLEDRLEIQTKNLKSIKEKKMFAESRLESLRGIMAEHEKKNRLLESDLKKEKENNLNLSGKVSSLVCKYNDTLSKFKKAMEVRDKEVERLSVKVEDYMSHPLESLKSIAHNEKTNVESVGFYELLVAQLYRIPLNQKLFLLESIYKYILINKAENGVPPYQHHSILHGVMEVRPFNLTKTQHEHLKFVLKEVDRVLDGSDFSKLPESEKTTLVTWIDKSIIFKFPIRYSNLESDDYSHLVKAQSFLAHAVGVDFLNSPCGGCNCWLSSHLNDGRNGDARALLKESELILELINQSDDVVMNRVFSEEFTGLLINRIAVLNSLFTQVLYSKSSYTRSVNQPIYSRLYTSVRSLTVGEPEPREDIYGATATQMKHVELLQRIGLALVNKSSKENNIDKDAVIAIINSPLFTFNPKQYKQELTPLATLPPIAGEIFGILKSEENFGVLRQCVAEYPSSIK
ncbi:hypothetical protein [Endozoicomonas ascidiicola]|uniref:hypothetical protein n=1 Tax=Endozoicomonas ascidiicola TaxID=1698521 RepID=UPI0008343424|nr:hypothetical protein [Endozoicomonas ascidiicola]